MKRNKVLDLRKLIILERDTKLAYKYGNTRKNIVKL